MKNDHDFLTVGSMGHCSAIAHGIAMAKPNKNIICIDGDGSLIMHMGNMLNIGQSQVNNLTHILLNNGTHESVGYHPTNGKDIDFSNIAKSLGYNKTYIINSQKWEENLSAALNNNFNSTKFIQVNTSLGVSANLGRPKHKLTDAKKNLMNNLKK